MKAIPSGNTTLKQNVLELLHEPQNTVFSEELYVVEVMILAFLFLSILAARLTALHRSLQIKYHENVDIFRLFFKILYIYPSKSNLWYKRISGIF